MALVPVNDVEKGHLVTQLLLGEAVALYETQYSRRHR